MNIITLTYISFNINYRNVSLPRYHCLAIFTYFFRFSNNNKYGRWRSKLENRKKCIFALKPLLIDNIIMMFLWYDVQLQISRRSSVAVGPRDGKHGAVERRYFPFRRARHLSAVPNARRRGPARPAGVSAMTVRPSPSHPRVGEQAAAAATRTRARPSPPGRRGAASTIPTHRPAASTAARENWEAIAVRPALTFCACVCAARRRQRVRRVIVGRPPWCLCASRTYAEITFRQGGRRRHIVVVARWFLSPRVIAAAVAVV